jgi:hypothetical protein
MCWAFHTSRLAQLTRKRLACSEVVTLSQELMIVYFFYVGALIRVLGLVDMAHFLAPNLKEVRFCVPG